MDQEDECTTDCPSALVRRVCDTYVVLPASTLFCDLIRAALAQLSFPTTDVLSASGMESYQYIIGNMWLMSALLFIISHPADNYTVCLL